MKSFGAVYASFTNGPYHGERYVNAMRDAATVARNGESAFAWGTARHVSVEGCQLIVGGEVLEQGQRLAFALDGGDRVSGAVRWVLGDRAGFAFDAPIRRDTVRAMQTDARLGDALELYLIERDGGAD